MGGVIFWLWLIIGGGAFIYLCAMLFERAVVSVLFDDPVLGKGFSVVLGWLTVSILFGLLTAGFRGFNPGGFLPFLIPAALVAVWNIRDGFRLRLMQAKLESGVDGGPYDEETARAFD